MTAAKDGSGTVRSGVFRFDPAHPLFADHFPGASVAPGSCIVQAFADEASRWIHEITDETTAGPNAPNAPDKTDPSGDEALLPLAGTGHLMQRMRPIRDVRGFRFRRFVTPGDYAFRMECTDGGIRCSLHALDTTGRADAPDGGEVDGGALGQANVSQAKVGQAKVDQDEQARPLVTGVLAW